MFVTGGGQAVFHSPDPTLTRARGRYFSRNPDLAPICSAPALIPWMGPPLLPPIINRELSGVWVGLGLEQGQGQGMPDKKARPRPLSGMGEKGMRPEYFGAPSAP